MSSGLARIVSAEKLKSRRRRSSWLVPLAIAAAAVLLFLAVGFAAKRDWIGVPSGFFIASKTMSLSMTVLSIITIIMTCFHISGEFALGTVKAAWIRPVSRDEWFIGKLITAGLAAAALYLLAAAVVSTLASLSYGFSDLTEKDYLVHSAGSLSARYMLALGLGLWAMLALVSVSAMLASMINRPGSAISVAVVLLLVFAVLGMFPQVSPFLLNTCVTGPFEQMNNMSRGLPLPFDWGGLVWKGLACSSAWMILGVAGGLWITRRKEITF